MSDEPVDVVAVLEEFHDAFEEEQRSRSQENQDFRLDLLKEEVEELEELVNEEGFDAAAVREELVDIIYVSIGTMVCFDLDLYEQFVETHEENMDKQSLKTPEHYE